jgi:predicted DsbA family dithiol-disulfide isomerase
MEVEIFSDVICPWCAVGKRRFETALAGFEQADEVEVHWRAFELDPRAPSRREGDYAERLAKKYGMTRAQALEANRRLTATAAAEGLDFRFDKVQPGNTFDAHRLLRYARESAPGMQDALKERLFVAYFTEGCAIGEPQTLVRLAGEVGLDPQECTEILTGTRYADEVRADEREAMELGVTGVPFFVVDGRFAIPGAQDAPTILSVLRRAWAKSHSLEMVVPTTRTGDAAACEDDTCGV